MSAEDTPEVERPEVEKCAGCVELEARVKALEDVITKSVGRAQKKALDIIKKNPEAKRQLEEMLAKADVGAA